MRQPDFELIITKNFTQLLKDELYQVQEILHGKSFCDICLSDSRRIQSFLLNSRRQIKSKVYGSLIEQIIDGDGLRKEIFISTGFYPQVLLVNYDLNLMSTIERAIKLNSYKSLKIILEQIFDSKDQSAYQPHLMYDLPLILNCNQVEINDFFKLNKQDLGSPCKFETIFESSELPPFQSEIQKNIMIQQFPKFLDVQKSIIKSIVESNVCKQRESKKKKFEIEYSYIDFHMQIIGEKVRHFKEKKKQICFDDLYYSKLLKLQSENSNNDKLFLQKSIQKMIDSQWHSTFIIQATLLVTYFFFFLLPISFVSFQIYENKSTSRDEKNKMIKIALVPALILSAIYAIQIKEQGHKYFGGWNLLNLTQLAIFYYITMIRLWQLDHEVYQYAIFRLINITLAFFKLLSFVRIFEDYGFLVQMTVYCIQDLIPTLFSYIMFLIMFSVCYHLLQMEIDPEISEAALKITYFEQLLIETFRNAIGELALPKYEKVLEEQTFGNQRDPSFFLYLNIILIWLVFFVQTFFLNIILLNFMIAVIMETYEKVTNGNLQVVIQYKHKAEVNYQTLILKSFLTKLPEYRCLIFSSTTLENQIFENQLIENFTQMKRQQQQQKQDLNKIGKETEKALARIIKNQDAIEQSVMDYNIKMKAMQDKMLDQLQQNEYQPFIKKKKMQILNQQKSHISGKSKASLKK